MTQFLQVPLITMKHILMLSGIAWPLGPEARPKPADVAQEITQEPQINERY